MKFVDVKPTVSSKLMAKTKCSAKMFKIFVTRYRKNEENATNLYNYSSNIFELFSKNSGKNVYSLNLGENVQVSQRLKIWAKK